MKPFPIKEITFEIKILPPSSQDNPNQKIIYLKLSSDSNLNQWADYVKQKHDNINQPEKNFKMNLIKKFLYESFVLHKGKITSHCQGKKQILYFYQPEEKTGTYIA